MASKARKGTVRNRRDAEEWRALVRRYEASGLTQAEFCRDAGVALSSFGKWRRQLRRGSGAVGATADAVETAGSRFVSLDGMLHCDSSRAAAKKTHITVEVGGGVVVHIVCR